MKNKRLAIILTMLLFIAVVVVLSSTVFSLSTIEVKFYSTTNNLTNLNDSIIESGNFNIGENVLFLNKTLHTNLLEKANPYLKVLNLETVFPNKIYINAMERNEVFAIKLSDNSYVVCDEELKVLKTQSAYYNHAQNAMELFVTTTEENLSAGDFLTTSKNNLILNSFVALKEWDLSYVNLKAKIKSITIDYDDRINQIMIEMRSGVKIIIYEADKLVSDKMNLAFSFYENTENDYTSEGVIEIRQLNNGQITGFYYRETWNTFGKENKI